MTTIEKFDVNHRAGIVEVATNADCRELTPDGARALAHILTVHADAAAAEAAAEPQ